MDVQIMDLNLNLNTLSSPLSSPHSPHSEGFSSEKWCQIISSWADRQPISYSQSLELRKRVLDFVKQLEFATYPSHELDLSGLQLPIFPTPILQLAEHIHTLNLSDNQLKELPPEIENLTELECLVLRNNQLTELPVEIGNLSKLQSLSATHNLLRSLPKEIRNLQELKLLILFHNALQSIPEEICCLKNLESLHLNNNPNLSSLTLFFLNLPNLTELDLDNTNLSREEKSCAYALRYARSREIHPQSKLQSILELWTDYTFKDEAEVSIEQEATGSKKGQECPENLSSLDFLLEFPEEEQKLITEWLLSIPGEHNLALNSQSLAFQTCEKLLLLKGAEADQKSALFQEMQQQNCYAPPSKNPVQEIQECIIC